MDVEGFPLASTKVSVDAEMKEDTVATTSAVQDVDMGGNSIGVDVTAAILGLSKFGFEGGAAVQIASVFDEDEELELEEGEDLGTILRLLLLPLSMQLIEAPLLEEVSVLIILLLKVALVIVVAELLGALGILTPTILQGPSRLFRRSKLYVRVWN